MNRPVDPDYDYDAEERSWIPRGIQAFLIHLAGADPRVFRRIEDPDIRAGEAGTIAKLGFTVLIPFILAFVAGTYTLHTLLNGSATSPTEVAAGAVPEISFGWGPAIIAGAVWAIMILGIDVAIMSQLIKLPPVPAKKDLPQQPQQGRLLDRRQQSNIPTEPDPVVLQRPSGFKRFVLALIRIIMAATLGTVVSHCLVLGIFQKRVIGQVEEARVAKRKEIDASLMGPIQDLQKKIDTAESLMARTPEEMVAGYNVWKASEGESTEIVAPAAAPSSASAGPNANSISGKAGEPAPTAAPAALTPAQKKFADISLPFDQQIDAIRAQLVSARTSLNATDKELGDIRREVQQAEQLKRDEASGTVRTYEWKTEPFRNAAMPEQTTGKVGEGTQFKVVDAAIKVATLLVADREAERLTFVASIARYEAQIADLEKQRSEAVTELAGVTREQIAELERAAGNKMRTDAARISEDLKRQSGRLQQELAVLQEQRADALKPLTGKGYDIMEQTHALHSIADTAKTTSEKYSVLALIGVVMVCLMFIDLTPLLIKLMRSPGYYEHAMVAPPRRRPQPQPIPTTGQPRRPTWPGSVPPGPGNYGGPPPPPPPGGM